MAVYLGSEPSPVKETAPLPRNKFEVKLYGHTLFDPVQLEVSPRDDHVSRETDQVRLRSNLLPYTKVSGDMVQNLLDIDPARETSQRTGRQAHR